LDVQEKYDLIARPPTEEIVTENELLELLKTNTHAKHYLGIEISGFLHLGSLLSTGYKINDFIKAGVDCTIFLADWHTMINDKLGGDMKKISRISDYYEEAFKTVCPKVTIERGSKLYDKNPDYWKDLIHFTKHVSLARTMRTLTIMGRSENEEKIELAKLLYPPMQAVDIHYLDLDIVHAGMDQRKIHMLVREVFPKMGKDWKVPVAVHHKLLPSLSQPTDVYHKEGKVVGKMSKSDPNSGIFIHDDDSVIKSKIKKAWCEEGNVKNNPLLEIAKQILFYEENYKEITVNRPEKFGGNVIYTKFSEMESDFENKKLHPTDLKQTVADLLTPIVSKLRGKLALEHEKEISDIIKNSV
jgi:tyrosyl-tRNA synthetase